MQVLELIELLQHEEPEATIYITKPDGKDGYFVLRITKNPGLNTVNIETDE